MILGDGVKYMVGGAAMSSKICKDKIRILHYKPRGLSGRIFPASDHEIMFPGAARSDAGRRQTRGRRREACSQEPTSNRMHRNPYAGGVDGKHVAAGEVALVGHFPLENSSSKELADI